MKKITRLREVNFDKVVNILENEGNCEHLYALGEFLYYDISNSFSYDFITSWLNDEFNSENLLTNMHNLSLEEDDYIYIRDKFTDYTQKKYKNLFFKVSRNDLFKIIDDWLRVRIKAPKPLDILIIQEDDGSIIFKALDVEGEEIKVEKEFTVKERLLRLLHSLRKKFFC